MTRIVESNPVVGLSHVWRRLITSAERVAPTEATVLLLGETGTGKELVARTLHQLSARSCGPFIRVDCTSLTSSLCETELYGHVKGAFTGALERRLGRIELAAGGTLLLDEVGDLPPELQPKLLRVLQEREFEPVGSAKTYRADIRVLAATNVDLLAAVGSGRFRADLYYRLAGFVLRLPPLRERLEDIELLASHFLARETSALGRNLRGISEAAMSRLTQYAWPGNVRELRHAIERACIVANHALVEVDDFDLPLSAKDTPIAASHCGGSTTRHPMPLATLKEVQRQHILAVLDACHGVIEGERGAAAVLGLPASTLRFRARKLGISVGKHSAMRNLSATGALPAHSSHQLTA